MQMTSRTIVINFAEHQLRWHKAESKSPKPKKAKVGERECRVFEFEIFAIANPVVFVTGCTYIYTQIFPSIYKYICVY